MKNLLDYKIPGCCWHKKCLSYSQNFFTSTLEIYWKNFGRLSRVWVSHSIIKSDNLTSIFPIWCEQTFNRKIWKMVSKPSHAPHRNIVSISMHEKVFLLPLIKSPKWQCECKKCISLKMNAIREQVFYIYWTCHIFLSNSWKYINNYFSLPE